MNIFSHCSWAFKLGPYPDYLELYYWLTFVMNNKNVSTSEIT